MAPAETLVLLPPETGAAATPAPLARLAVSAEEAARMCGIGRTTLYAALAAGSLKSIKLGKRRLITVKALEAWLQAAEATHEGGN